MTTRMAIILMAAIIGFVVFDQYVLQKDIVVFLGREMIDVIAWIAFWR